MTTSKRRPRWNTGDTYAIPLSPQYCSGAQLLAAPFVALFDKAWRGDGAAPAPAPGQVARDPLYRILAVSPAALGDWIPLARLQLPAQPIPDFFSTTPNGDYKIWTRDGDRPATRLECHGLERMVIWGPDSLLDRLRAHFLRGGYTPPARYCA